VRLFVTVGNPLQPFDRMLRAVDAALMRHPGAFDGTCQHGTSTVRPHGLRAVASLPREAFEAEMMRADVVVMHAGVGSVHTALRQGHTPIVFARRKARGEHVDDHQEQLLAKFSRDGLALAADGEDALASRLDAFLRGEQRRGEGTAHKASEALRMIHTAIDGGQSRPTMGRFRRAGLAIAASLAPPLRELLIRGSA
jgi:UDP-N-acetylglucosamine transferase subunit ALG13